MRQILSFIQKEFRHIFRDVRTTMIVLVMPVVQIILFGYAVSTEVYNVVVDVVGDMTDPEVRRIVERIDANEYLRIGEVLPSVSEIEGRFRRGSPKAVLCFGDRFDSQAGSGKGASLRIVADGADPNTAQTVTAYLMGVLASEQMEMATALTGSRGPSFSPNIQLMYNPAMSSSYNFVPGVMGLILMLICSMMTAVSIVREKEFGTLELVLVSPVKPFWIVLSKLAPYLVLSLVNYVSVLLLAHYVMGVPVNGSLTLLTLASLVFVGSSLGLGLLVSVISKTQQTALMICGMGLTMPTMMLSGIIFPCESMPAVLQAISCIIPAKWYVIMVKKIMIQGVGFASVAKEFAVLTGMMAFLLYVSIKKFKTRL